MNIFHSFKHWFTPKKQPAEIIRPAMAEPDSRMAQKILGMLEKTQEEELSCDEVFALLDQAAELTARGEDLASLMPMVQQHLALCGDCREEYETLLNILQSPA
ncbi:MAG: hypothetical protein OHK0031_02470 [Anaerolineales bacterium]